jgi:alpha-beta hydrolase superfamily lysophospholipase
VTASTFTLETQDGTPVVVHRWEPDGEVRAVVNLAHGMAEHAARYAHVADALNASGIAVYAEDHRGHGETARTDDDLVFFAEERGWAKVLDDLHRVTLRARHDHPDVPLVLFGHSMGSFLAQQYLFTFGDELDGLVLSGSNGPIGPLGDAAALVARAERLRIGKRGRSAVLEKLSFGSYNRAFAPNRTDFDWLSRDPEQVDRYIADPRCGVTGTSQLYLDLFSGLRIIGQVERVRGGAPRDLPIYIFAGSEDPVGGRAGIAKLLAHYETAGLTAVEHQLYEGGRHEMVNETNRDEVLADLVDWLERRILARAA